MDVAQWFGAMLMFAGFLELVLERPERKSAN